MRTLKFASLAIAAATAVSCSPSHHDMEGQPAKLGDYSYEAPDGWKQVKSHGWHSITTTWTPEDNDHKESIVVIRTEIGPALAKAGTEAIKKQLLNAQQELPQVEVLGAVNDFRSGKNLTGVRIEDNFTPAGSKSQYHRAHTVLFDGTDIVHVLYTAAQPDSEEQALHLVVNSLHKSEG